MGGQHSVNRAKRQKGCSSLIFNCYLVFVGVGVCSRARGGEGTGLSTVRPLPTLVHGYRRAPCTSVGDEPPNVRLKIGGKVVQAGAQVSGKLTKATVKANVPNDVWIFLRSGRTDHEARAVAASVGVIFRTVNPAKGTLVGVGSCPTFRFARPQPVDADTFRSVPREWEALWLFPPESRNGHNDAAKQVGARDALDTTAAKGVLGAFRSKGAEVGAALAATNVSVMPWHSAVALHKAWIKGGKNPDECTRLLSRFWPTVMQLPASVSAAGVADTDAGVADTDAGVADTDVSVHIGGSSKGVPVDGKVSGQCGGGSNTTVAAPNRLPLRIGGETKVSWHVGRQPTVAGYTHLCQVKGGVKSDKDGNQGNATANSWLVGRCVAPCAMPCHALRECAVCSARCGVSVCSVQCAVLVRCAVRCAVRGA
jgi:hypothetical protein